MLMSKVTEITQEIILIDFAQVNTISETSVWRISKKMDAMFIRKYNLFIYVYIIYHWRLLRLKLLSVFSWYLFNTWFNGRYVDNDGWIPPHDKAAFTSSKAKPSSIAECVTHLPNSSAHISDSAEALQKTLSRESNFRVSACYSSLQRHIISFPLYRSCMWWQWLCIILSMWSDVSLSLRLRLWWTM